MPHVIGTAGHIDHGKTSLLKALTGQDTDRLKEEKERGISIDLGFAYMDLPNGERAGIVDVPGHERFIRNMLAGAQGIDLALFTVAADDGVMPQTEEHFDFLYLLGVEKGIFVISKVDMVESGRIEEVREEIQILTLDTCFEDAPILPVSCVTGEGVDSLREEIVKQLGAHVRPELPGYFRLPVDRVFTLKGHGVVVTGTAIAGGVNEGSTVRILPSRKEARVRSLQVHGESVRRARSGQRLALNLVGLDKKDVVRGSVVCDPKVSMTTTRFDARVEIRPNAGRMVGNHERVRIHLGTAEIIGKIVLLGGMDFLEPKAKAMCQIVSEEPLVALRGDRFVLRNETAQLTLGGGVVLHPFARRHRKAEADMIPRLEALQSPQLREACHAYLEVCPQFAVPIEELYHGVNAEEDEILRVLKEDSEVLPFPDSSHPEAYSIRGKWDRLVASVEKCLSRFHTESPLALGMEMESLRSQLSAGLTPKLFRVVTERLMDAKVMVREGSVLRLKSHSVTLSQEDTEVAARLERCIEDGAWTPPDMANLQTKLGLTRKQLNEFIGVLESRDAIAKVTPDFYLSTQYLDRARNELTDYLSKNDEITAAAFRDCLSISRKTAIPLLEYFDRTGLTLRVGDARRLRKTK